MQKCQNSVALNRKRMLREDVDALTNPDLFLFWHLKEKTIRLHILLFIV